MHDRYLPPEFFMHGIVDEKTDVFAFGVLLLELITGRQALDSSQQSLVMWVCFTYLHPLNFFFLVLIYIHLIKYMIYAVKVKNKSKKI